MEFMDEDDYETEAQATARVKLTAPLTLSLEVLAEQPETIVEYAAFNDAEYFEPLFASGELPDSVRHVLDDPLHVSNNLRSAVRFADLRNLERADQDKMGTYGPVIIRTRTVIRSPWKVVSYDDIDAVRRR